MSCAILLRRADPCLKALVVIGTVVYLLELSAGPGVAGHLRPLFRWAERVIALTFTLEYIARWVDDAQDHRRWHYPHSPLGVVDLVSVLPFWAGLVAPAEWAHLVRTLRVFRLLKFFRYSRSLQLVALGFYRAWPALRPLLFTGRSPGTGPVLHHGAWPALRPLLFTELVVGLFCTVAVYEVESAAQPDKFATLFDAAYFTTVTVATVGYGDLTPVTPAGRAVTMLMFVTALAIFPASWGSSGRASSG